MHQTFEPSATIDFTFGIASGSKQDNHIITVCHLVSNLFIIRIGYVLHLAERKQDTIHVVVAVSPSDPYAIIFILITNIFNARAFHHFLHFHISLPYIDISSVTILPPRYLLTPTCRS